VLIQSKDKELIPVKDKALIQVRDKEFIPAGICGGLVAACSITG
jgi:UTP-glucose-1-phosphate uridylyltransferase